VAAPTADDRVNSVSRVRSDFAAARLAADGNNEPAALDPLACDDEEWLCGVLDSEEFAQVRFTCFCEGPRCLDPLDISTRNTRAHAEFPGTSAALLTKSRSHDLRMYLRCAGATDRRSLCKSRVTTRHRILFICAGSSIDMDCRQTFPHRAVLSICRGYSWPQQPTEVRRSLRVPE
jgi:hypothetical protein